MSHVTVDQRSDAFGRCASKAAKGIRGSRPNMTRNDDVPNRLRTPVLNAHCTDGNIAIHSESGSPCPLRIAFKGFLEYLLHHPLDRAVYSRGICQINPMLNTEPRGCSQNDSVPKAGSVVTRPNPQIQTLCSTPRVFWSYGSHCMPSPAPATRTL